MSNNFNDILSVLDTINREVSVPIYIPSLKRDVKFKSISTGQQKSILKAAVDNPVFQTRFTIAFYALIQENCLEKDVVPLLTTLDAACIAIQFRVNTAGTDYTIQQNNRKFNVNLQTVIDKIKSNDVTLNADTVTETPFTVQVGTPLYVDQFNLEKQLREKNTNDQQVINTQLTDTIGDAFVGEVSKFVKNVTVYYNNETQQIDFTTLPFAKRHALLEKMPSTVVKGVLKYMEKYVNIQKDILTVTGTDIENGEVVSDLVLLVDSALFVVSQ